MQVSSAMAPKVLAGVSARSLQDVVALSRIMYDIPIQFVELAIVSSCACLDGPVFDPHKALPPSQNERVKLALFALISIANINEVMFDFVEGGLCLGAVPGRSWWAWLQSFFYNDNPVLTPEPSVPLDVVLRRSWPAIWRWLQYFFYNNK